MNFKEDSQVKEFCSNLIEYIEEFSKLRRSMIEYIEEHPVYKKRGEEITLEQLNEDIQDYMNIMLKEMRRKK